MLMKYQWQECLSFYIAPAVDTGNLMSLLRIIGGADAVSTESEYAGATEEP